MEQVSTYACANADMTGRLAPLLTKGTSAAERPPGNLLEKVELPLVPVLAHMERCGVMLDTATAKRDVRSAWVNSWSEIEKKIYADAGQEFNINSPLQLGVVLFEKLHLPGKKVRGKYSTDASVLEELRDYPDSVSISWNTGS